MGLELVRLIPCIRLGTPPSVSLRERANRSGTETVQVDAWTNHGLATRPTDGEPSLPGRASGAASPMPSPDNPLKGAAEPTNVVCLCLCGAPSGRPAWSLVIRGGCQAMLCSSV
jgi:hypothetical protein